MSRSLSLRARVALVSGVVAALVAVTLGIAYFALLQIAGARQLDDTVSTMGVRVATPADVVPAVPGVPALPAPPVPPIESPPVPGAPQSPSVPTQYAQTIPAPQAVPAVIAPGSPPVVPQAAIADEAIAPVLGAPGLLVTLSPDRDLVDAAITRSQLIGIGIGVAAVVVAAVLGWLLAGFAARPLRTLATATHRIDTLEQLPPLSGRGVREAEELSDAITRMLGRLESAHGVTHRALAGARDFAAVCAHELRTPLTAMRTDLQVLLTKELPAEQHRTILTEVLATQQQIEHTLTDLERLAVGELTDPDAFEPFELCETLDRAIQDARRHHPGIHIDLTACDPIPLTGLPGGIMLIVTNAVANAVQHGNATTITVAAHREDTTAEITIDDNGTGLPENLTGTAFNRFIKGPGSPGSGLGLALVRQQAELHSGTAELTTSPLGGARLRVTIPFDEQ